MVAIPILLHLSILWTYTNSIQSSVSFCFPQIEKIEVTLRCRLSNYFCVTYGVLGYQDPQNFSSPIFHHSFMQEAQNEIKRNRRAPFIKNFQENYEGGAIPFYALVEIFSFGTLSKFFKNLKNPDKKAIASTYQVAFSLS